MASAALPISASRAMAASLRLASPPLLNPRSRSSPHLLRPFPSKAVAFTRFPTLKPSQSSFLLGFSSAKKLRVVSCVARNEEGQSSDSGVGDEADAARGQSTLPERFRYLTKEAPERPVRWPWVIALVFLVYAWRTVLWELGNWKKAAMAITTFFAYLSKLLLAFVFRFIGDPLTGLIRCIEFSLYSVRYIYSNIVAFAPVPELTRIILFSSTVLAIAEAVVPESVSSQYFLLSFSGIVGFGAVSGYIPEVIFWLFLSGLFCYSYFIKKKDGISAALPSAAVLVAVGQPWLRFIVLALYLALAIHQHSKLSEIGRKEASGSTSRFPIPLQVAALSIGIHVAAKWVRHRHLTWMVA
ncbi:uncharacterized protein [Typha latifolia]|uniref:uncharacterized protein n=1 Tax=Typha latifolia TaxID=4733 RepID=UPI003C2EDDEE